MTKINGNLKIENTNVDLNTIANDSMHSSTEQIIGKWINNKPIYRKVLYIQSLPNCTATGYSHGISNLEQIINISAIQHGIYEGQEFWEPLVWLNPGSNTTISYDSISWEVSKSQFHVLSQNMNKSSRDATVIIEYTKTTD